MTQATDVGGLEAGSAPGGVTGGVTGAVAELGQTLGETLVLGNTAFAWTAVGVSAFGVFVGLLVARRVALARLKPLAGRTRWKWDDLAVEMVAGLRPWVIGAVVVLVASQFLVLPEVARRAIRIVGTVAIAVQVMVAAKGLIDLAIARLIDARGDGDGSQASTLKSASGIIRILALAAAGVTVLLLTLDNLGVQITPLIASLGIGGVAVALAAQSIFADLFGSIIILFDKPFLVGDFIIVGDKMGTVERIGIKTTRVRALSGEQLVFSNSDLLSSRIQNFKRMRERRVVFSVGVIYETPLEKLRRVPEIIREAVAHQSNARLDRVHFKAFGAYSLDFEAVYFVTAADFNIYMDTQQAINFEILRAFQDEGISFAYPTAVEIQRPADPLPVSAGSGGSAGGGS